jgi:hypothetical protein
MPQLKMCRKFTQANLSCSTTKKYFNQAAVTQEFFNQSEKYFGRKHWLSFTFFLMGNFHRCRDSSKAITGSSFALMQFSADNLCTHHH